MARNFSCASIANLSYIDFNASQSSVLNTELRTAAYDAKIKIKTVYC